jgi:hypothetical protein
MRLRPVTPRKTKLALLFEAARRRLTRDVGVVAGLPSKRIVTATAELNHIADDIQDAQPAPIERVAAVRDPPSLLISTVGKIVRWPKDRN